MFNSFAAEIKENVQLDALLTLSEGKLPVTGSFLHKGATVWEDSVIASSWYNGNHSTWEIYPYWNGALVSFQYKDARVEVEGVPL